MQQKYDVIAGKARFSCLSPFLVRLEYDENGLFENLPSFRAISRPKAIAFKSHETSGKSHVFDTGEIKITYLDDQKPFSEENLKIQYLCDGDGKTWTPSQVDHANLGGANESYDEYSRSFVPNGVAEASIEDLDLNTLLHIAKIRKSFNESFGRPWDVTTPVREFQFEAIDRLEELPDELKEMIQRRIKHPTGILSRSGYFLLNDSATPLIDPSTDWWKERPNKNSQDWYFFGYGLNFSQGLKDFTLLCGPIPMLPKWVFGIWFSVFKKIDDKGNRDIVKKFHEENLPIDSLVIDLYWHTHDWYGFDWNKEWYPDPKALIEWMHEKGVKIGLNVHPGSLPAMDSKFKLLCEELDIKTKDLEKIKADKPEVYNIWDISRKKDADLIVEHLLRPVQEDGIDLWWVDGPSPTKAVPETAWTNHVYFEAMEKYTQKRPVILSRYGGIGNHRYPIQFTGDTASQWEVLKSQVSLTAQGGNVGDSYLSHDIGGFVGEEFWDGKVNPELFVRWVQFGCFSPVIRLHSCFGIREPWEYEKKVFEAIREAFHLRMSLIPYIYNFSQMAHMTGMPLCRPLYLHYPKDDNAYRYKDEYMFGESLLVAPVVASGGEITIYYPEGKWYIWESNTVLEGPIKKYLLKNYNEIPVYVKAGSIIPRQKMALSTALASNKQLILDIYPGAPGELTELKLYEDDGESRDYRNGKYAISHIKYSHKKGKSKLSIQEGDGHYKGRPKNREYIINIYSTELPLLEIEGVIVEPSKKKAAIPHWTFKYKKS